MLRVHAFQESLQSMVALVSANFFSFFYILYSCHQVTQEAQVNYSNFVVATSGFSLMIWESQESLQFMLQSSFIFTWLSPCFEDDFCKSARPSRETYISASLLYEFINMKQLQSWTKVLRKLHTWGALLLNFVAHRFFPTPLPLKAVLLGL